MVTTINSQLLHVEQYPFVLSLSQHELASERGL
jgi:hypothetical protein